MKPDNILVTGGTYLVANWEFPYSIRRIYSSKLLDNLRRISTYHSEARILLKEIPHYIENYEKDKILFVWI